MSRRFFMTWILAISLILATTATDAKRISKKDKNKAHAAQAHKNKAAPKREQVKKKNRKSSAKGKRAAAEYIKAGKHSVAQKRKIASTHKEKANKKKAKKDVRNR